MDADVLVIGAGVVGLSVGLKLLDKGFKVIIVEKENNFGKGISSRNSEQIHSGAYYRPGSLKSKLAFKGKNLLYEFFNKYKIPYSQTGKIFLALNNEDLNGLDRIKNLSKKNGLEDLIELESKDLKKVEPNIVGKAGL